MYSKVFEELIKKKLKDPARIPNSILAEVSEDIDSKLSSFKSTFEVRYEGDAENPAAIEAMAQKAAESRIEEILEGIQSSQLLDGDKFAQGRYYKGRKKVVVSPPPRGLRYKNGKFISGISLAAILNTVMYQYMYDLMKSPSLIWRTGRLGHSVQISRIIYAPPTGRQRKGRVSVAFMYMKYPYEAFMNPDFRAYRKSREPVALITKAIQTALDDLLHKTSKQTNIFNVQEVI